MNIPTLPTDNLYKFLALSGLSGAVVLMVTFTIMVNKTALKSAELTGTISVLERKTKRVEEEVKLVGNELEKMETKKLETKNDAIESARALEDIKMRNRDAKEQLLIINDLNHESLKEAIINNMALANINSLKYVVFIFVIYFISQSALGFILWYHKLQKYQDAILKKQVESSNN